jgi:hypothetical protein
MWVGPVRTVADPLLAGRARATAVAMVKREKAAYMMALERGLWRVDDIAYDLPGEPARTLRGEPSGK